MSLSALSKLVDDLSALSTPMDNERPSRSVASTHSMSVDEKESKLSSTRLVSRPL